MSLVGNPKILLSQGDFQVLDAKGTDGTAAFHGVAERDPPFSQARQGYFWGYDNNGLKWVQRRFYEIATDADR